MTPHDRLYLRLARAADEIGRRNYAAASRAKRRFRVTERHAAVVDAMPLVFDLAAPDVWEAISRFDLLGVDSAVDFVTSPR